MKFLNKLGYTWAKLTWEYIRKTTPKELELFKKNPIDLTKSYIVYGNRELLLKFKVFFILQGIKVKATLHAVLY